ncbi:MAG: alpha/beta fold hydrolase [Pirellulales bacterium]|nr:alpha/beta fold hydrolase [Pirellulales bacterium]
MANFVFQFTAAIAITLIANCALGAETAEAEGGTPAPRITRADLGRSYLRLEQVYFSNLPDEAEHIAGINKVFDKSTLAFFGGNFAGTLRVIDQLSAELLAGPSPELLAAMALHADFDPPVLTLDSDRKPQLNLRMLYDPETRSATSVRLTMQGLFNASLDINAENRLSNSSFDLSTLRDRLQPGIYELKANTKECEIVVARWIVVDRSLDEIRQDNEERLAKLHASTPAIEAAIAACKDRNELLTNSPSTEKSAQFNTDLNALASDVAIEIGTLEKGADPYRLRAGDYWRTVRSGDRSIPLRVFAPDKCQEVACPLIVALHGAGADENMFFQGYGAGRIKQLAEQHGAIVVTPSTYAMASNGDHFDALLTALAHDYDIDSRRVYVLGHSMGGGVAANLAATKSNQIARACCLAGYRVPKSEKMSPTLIIAAELDGVVAAAGLEKSAQKSVDIGLPVELRVMPNYGHTLMVGVALPEAIDWLFQSDATP